MIYVFDSCTFITLFTNIYASRFPSLWEDFDALVAEQRIVSVREVRRELEGHNNRLSDWVNAHREVFLAPTVDELRLVAEIFEVPHFQAMVRKQELLQGKSVADPFVIASAWALDGGYVVTQETMRPNAAKIPNVCEHFGVSCLNLEAFMEIEDWRY